MMLSPKDILLSLIEGEGARVWASSRRGWSESSSDPVCSWEGVSCDQNGGRVTAIDLHSMDLMASIPTEFGLLTSITKLNLSHNLLRGTIDGLATLPNLVEVVLAENMLSGTVPLFASPSLTNLDLGFNSFDGSLPATFLEANRALIRLELRHNTITGFLPSTLGSLKEIKKLSFSHNLLWGTIPAFDNMPSLQNLYLNNNQIVGTIPGEWGVDGPAKLSNMFEVWLDDNNLSGTIPQGLANWTNLSDVWVSGNKLTGTIPTALCSEEINSDFFANTDKPDFEKGGYCDAVACPANEISSNDHSPCIKCPSTIPIPYIGQIDQCGDLDEVKIVTKLFTEVASNVQSACDFDGVTCNRNDQVVKIELSGRKLKGTIPDELGFLEKLQVLDLSDNEFTGYLPSGLRFAPLKRLDVSGNRIHGVVPPLLCQTDMNGNGINSQVHVCDAIACSIGTYSKLGYGACKVCPGGALYLGSKFCLPESVKSQAMAQDSTMPDGAIIGIVFAVVASICFLGYVFIRTQLYLKYDKGKGCGDNNKGYGVDGLELKLPHVQGIYSNVKGSILRQWDSTLSLIQRVPRLPLEPGKVHDVGWKQNEVNVQVGLGEEEKQELKRIVKRRKSENDAGVWAYPDPMEMDVFEDEGKEDDGLIMI